jgi:hypothetical protein
MCPPLLVQEKGALRLPEITFKRIRSSLVCWPTRVVAGAIADAVVLEPGEMIMVPKAMPNGHGRVKVFFKGRRLYCDPRQLHQALTKVIGF